MSWQASPTTAAQLIGSHFALGWILQIARLIWNGTLSGVECAKSRDQHAVTSCPVGLVTLGAVFWKEVAFCVCRHGCAFIHYLTVDS
jgi:hypothetical protein